MSKNIWALRQRKVELLNRCQQIIDEGEARALTTAEDQEYKTLVAKPRRPAATLPRRSPRHSTERRIANLDRSYSATAVALSQVRRTYGRRRTIHCGPTPTPFSTTPGHSSMKSLAHTSHCRRASERLAQVCLDSTQPSSSCLRLGSLRPSTRLCTGAPAATPAASTPLPNFYKPPSLHSICISPASAAPAASF